MSRWLFDALLRLSYSSELGAATAYGGHATHLALQAHRVHVEQVRRDELAHREELGRMLADRGLRPWRALELTFFAIGSTVAFGCRFWGDWASATGAGMFEVNGVSEYRRLAAMARRAGADPLVPCFERMEAQERAHRDLFREMSRGAAAVLPLRSEP